MMRLFLCVDCPSRKQRFAARHILPVTMIIPLLQGTVLSARPIIFFSVQA
ncbi:Uncharacterized protein {ECO:0000313/EMBL:CCF09757.1} [Pantoea ananatis]|nr:Uncharacterized protein {ECO:0000313/EMBL:CCF09757.1} [Pantoea ananatis]